MSVTLVEQDLFLAGVKGYKRQPSQKDKGTHNEADNRGGHFKGPPR